MSYLKHKPGSIEELMANEASKLNDNAYQQMFKKELDKAGKGIGGMSPKEKKDFFNKIDSKYKAKSEVKEARVMVDLNVGYKNSNSDDEVEVVIDIPQSKMNDEAYIEDEAINKAEELLKQKKIGPRNVNRLDPMSTEMLDFNRTSKSLNHYRATQVSQNEAKVDELTKAQEKLPPALQKAIKDKEMKEEDAYDNDRFIIKNGKATVDNSNTADSKDHVHAPNAKIALQLHKQGKKVYKEDLGKEDDSIVKAVVGQLKKAVKAHDVQAKDLEKAMKTEADQHGDEINDKKHDAAKKGEKDIKKMADSGSKLTKVETEPKVDYKN